MVFIVANIAAFIAVFIKYSITTHLRLAHFLSQMAHETMGFKKFEENLNYSASRLLEVFPNYFNNSTAQQYANKPKLIGSRVYANRYGNGNEQSGDGYKYRGRGFVHLTFKSNYQAYSNYSGTDIVNNPDLAARLDIALDIAGWYWKTRGINAFSDADDIINVNKKINGGTNGLADRKTRLNYYKTQNLLALFEKKKQ